jgi:hypothetical protein
MNNKNDIEEDDDEKETLLDFAFFAIRIIGFPILAIFCVNTLFDKNIELTITSWVAALIALIILHNRPLE